MSRPALPEEVGTDLFREGDEPPAPELCHDVERVDDHDGPPFDRSLVGGGFDHGFLVGVLTGGSDSDHVRNSRNRREHMLLLPITE